MILAVNYDLYHKKKRAFLADGLASLSTWRKSSSCKQLPWVETEPSPAILEKFKLYPLDTPVAVDLQLVFVQTKNKNYYHIPKDM